MFEPIPELASDLEWMLQSGQASSDMLAEALIKEYSSPVYRLGLAMLEDAQAAWEITVNTFSSALLNVYRIQNGRNHSGTEIQTWLFRIAIELIRKTSSQLKTSRAPKTSGPADFDSTISGAARGGAASGVAEVGAARVSASSPDHELDAALCAVADSLPGKQRWPAILHYTLNWPAEKIAGVLQLRDSDVTVSINDARQNFQAVLDQAGRNTGSELQNAGGMDARIETCLKKRWPAPDFQPAQTASLLAEVQDQARRGSAGRRRLASFKEITLTLVAIFVVVGLIWGANVLIPEPLPTELPVSTARTTRRNLSGSGSRRLAQPTSSGLEAVRQTPTPQGIFYEVLEGDDLFSIAERFSVSPAELLVVNRLASPESLKEGQLLVISSGLPQETQVAPTPVTPVAQPMPSQTPVSSAEILQHIDRARRMYHTLWLDAQILVYGPAGYVGPAKASRMQMWMSQDQFLVINGPNEGSPEEILLLSDDHMYIAKPGSGQPWFVELGDRRPFYSSAEINLNLLFSPPRSSFPQSGGLNLQVKGDERVAGRRAWIVEQGNSSGTLEARLWLDTRTGFILRRQQFDAGEDNAINNETLVTAIGFDVDFPQDLFDSQLPWRGGYAEDFTGKPLSEGAPLPSWIGPAGMQSLPYQPAPGGFDPSQSSLTFQFPRSFNSDGAVINADIFAGEYYLGTVEFGNPWTMICDRSPDGEKIAFVSQPFKSEERNAFLRWFELGNPARQFFRPLRGIFITHFAFSPDSRRLAAFGFDGQFSAGAIYIIDLETEQTNLLMYLQDAKSFVWSPDGDYLALIGAPTSLFEEEVMVIQTDSGDITYRSQIDVQRRRDSREWPMVDWGVEFPVEMGGLEACAAP